MCSSSSSNCIYLVLPPPASNELHELSGWGAFFAKYLLQFVLIRIEFATQRAIEFEFATQRAILEMAKAPGFDKILLQLNAIGKNFIARMFHLAGM